MVECATAFNEAVNLGIRRTVKNAYGVAVHRTTSGTTKKKYNKNQRKQGILMILSLYRRQSLFCHIIKHINKTGAENSELLHACKCVSQTN